VFPDQNGTSWTEAKSWTATQAAPAQVDRDQLDAQAGKCARALAARIAAQIAQEPALTLTPAP
jgi:hypothetical protein